MLLASVFFAYAMLGHASVVAAFSRDVIERPGWTFGATTGKILRWAAMWPLVEINQFSEARRAWAWDARDIAGGTVSASVKLATIAAWIWTCIFAACAMTESPPLRLLLSATFVAITDLLLLPVFFPVVQMLLLFPTLFLCWLVCAPLPEHREQPQRK